VAEWTTAESAAIEKQPMNEVVQCPRPIELPSTLLQKMCRRWAAAATWQRAPEMRARKSENVENQGKKLVEGGRVNWTRYRGHVFRI
jgi:hypothetical protein